MSQVAGPAREAVIELARIGDALGARLSAAAVEDDETLRFRPLGLEAGRMPRLDTCDNVRAYGGLIHDALCLHPAIRDELRQLFLTRPPEVTILRFLMGGGSGADLFRWEAVCSSDAPGFPAVAGGCAVCRVADVASQAEPTAQAFDYPVRMAAFLSPAGVSAEAEFDVLRRSVAQAVERGLDVACTAYLGQQDLLDRAGAMAADGALPGVEVAWMPPDAAAIEEVLKARPAQILHFFCHGVVEVGEPLLEFATINDWDLGADRGTAMLSVERLRAILAATRGTWLTVLNSCSGGQAVDRLHSMAFSLAKGGSPFALGMAEPIRPEDATACTAALYEGLFDMLRTRLSGLRPGDAATLDLAPAVVPARVALHRTYWRSPPDAFGRWCLPILYRRKTPLRIMLVPDDVAERIAAVAGALRVLPADTPIRIRDAVLASLDEEPSVAAALRPDRFGNVGA